MPRYLLIDGAQLDELDPLRLALAQTGTIALYADLGASPAIVGPLLLTADTDLWQQCADWESGPPRRYAVAEIEADAPLSALASHLQRLRYLHISEHRQHFLRYADTRVMQNLMKILTPAQAAAFAGPAKTWTFRDRAGELFCVDRLEVPPASLPLRLSAAQTHELLRLSRPDQLLVDVLDDDASLRACGTPAQRHQWAGSALEVARSRRLQWQPWEQALVHAALRSKGAALRDPAFLRALDVAQAAGDAESLYAWRSGEPMLEHAGDAS